MQNPGAVALDRLPVEYQGAHVDIRCSGTTPNIAYKSMRVVPQDVQSKAQLDAMINGLHMQQLQVGGVEHSRVSPILIANAAIGGIPVPTIQREWYQNGNIAAFLSRNANANKLALVKDVACGLAHLHTLNIVHGNLHPDNVLITDDRRACITDAGLYAAVVHILHPDRLLVPTQWPYKSPEELTTGTRTSHTDVYSFACIVYFIYTEKPIFKTNVRNPSTRNMRNIMDRGHLETLSNSKPTQMSEELWDLLGRCWSVNPMSRPTMIEVMEEMGGLVPD